MSQNVIIWGSILAVLLNTFLLIYRQKPTIFAQRLFCYLGGYLLFRLQVVVILGFPELGNWVVLPAILVSFIFVLIIDTAYYAIWHNGTKT